MLYVHYLARDCSGLSNCMTVTEEMIPRGGTIKMLQRNYIVPGTMRGASPELVLNPVVVVLDGMARPKSE
ncbi:hypothetical protein [Vulgatibacter sp.]|uniref:hypothetical protein n=1 Tax=Vulgatibacter sp. TaxID=1971226 RepID=UPI003561F2F0